MLLEDLNPILPKEIEELLEYDFGEVVLLEGQTLEEGIVDNIKRRIPDYLTHAKENLKSISNSPKTLSRTAFNLLKKVNYHILQIPYPEVKQTLLNTIAKLGIRKEAIQRAQADPRLQGKDANEVKQKFINNLKVVGMTLATIPIVKTISDVMSKSPKETVAKFVQGEGMDSLLDTIGSIGKTAAAKLVDPSMIAQASAIGAAPVQAAAMAGKAAVGAAKELHGARQAAKSGDVQSYLRGS